MEGSAGAGVQTATAEAARAAGVAGNTGGTVQGAKSCSTEVHGHTDGVSMQASNIISIKKLFTNLLNSLSESQRTQISVMAGSAVDFTEAWPYADITFIVGGRKLFASKMILSMWSPVFEAMFRNNFKEKNAKEIELPGKEFDDVLEMLKVLHPPNAELCGDNVVKVLPLAQEYQIEQITERCEEFLMSQASSVRNYLLALKFNLPKLEESNMAYLKRAPVARLRNQADFSELDQSTLVALLMEKCEKFESHLEELRDVRMVLERKKPTSFPGMHLLCDSCTGAREQQVDCVSCMKGCCRKITDILRNLER